MAATSKSSQEQICAWVETPGLDAEVEIRHVPIPLPGSGEVLIKLEVTGVCHSDHHSIYGNTPMTTHIAGHEGVGRVVSLGPGVSREDICKGKRVGVSWLYRSCGSCETCAVRYTHCPLQDNTGRNMPGTFEQYCVADATYVTAIPDQVPAAMAAPLLCGGITMYGALVNAQLKPGEFVVLLGAGGGLGHIGVQIGSTLGYRVIAIDAADKENVCISSGAELFFAADKSDGLVENVKSATKGVGAHAVLCIAGATSAYDDAVSMLRNCGQLICIGIPPADYRLKVNPFELLVRGLKIVGSTVGDASQMKELMELAVQKKIKPIVQIFEFDDVEAVLKSLGSGKITGRAVLLIPQ